MSDLSLPFIFLHVMITNLYLFLVIAAAVFVITPTEISLWQADSSLRCNVGLAEHYILMTGALYDDPSCIYLLAKCIGVLVWAN
jgi:hypothetical protein